jgi:hypothetical protein
VGKKLLEGALPGQPAITEHGDVSIIEFVVEPGRNNQNVSGQIPCLPQRLLPLNGVLNNIDDVAEVDDVGWSLFDVRLVVWIPALSVDTATFEPVDVITSTAPVIKDRDPT